MTQEKASPSNGRIAWGRYALILGIAAWMFILGVLVGRGTAPVQFDTQALQKELAALRDSMVKKEREIIEQAMHGEDAKASLGFYEALKKDGTDTTVRTEQSTATSHRSDTAPHKTRAALMPKKKSRAVKPTSPANDSNPLPAAARQGRLTIQIASLRDGPSAQRMVANLVKRGYPAYLSRHHVADKGLWYRVRVGRYPNEKQAAADMARLTGDHKNPILVKADTE